MSADRFEWKQVNLSEICVVDWGNTDLTKSAFVDGGQYLGISAAGCDGRIDHAEHKAGTPVLSAIGARCGTMFFPEEDFTAIKNTITLTPRSGVADGKFLYYLFTYIELPKRGAAQPFISKGDIQSFRVGIPPLNEQKRIVAILDEAFEGIAKTTANVERNLANARELLAEGLRTVFTSSDADWVTLRIGDVCTLKSGHTLPPDLEKTSGDIPYLKVADMTYPGNETEVTTSSRFLEESSVKAGGIIPVGATIFPKRGGAILTNKKRITRVRSWLDLNIMAVIPSARIDPEFLHMYFQSVDMRRLGSGSSIPQINNYDIEPLEIAMPTAVEEQREVADRLMALGDQSRRLEELYNMKLQGLFDLKQSLLHKAFSGQLTDKVAIAA